MQAPIQATPAPVTPMEAAGPQAALIGSAQQKKGILSRFRQRVAPYDEGRKPCPKIPCRVIDGYAGYCAAYGGCM